MTGSVQANAPPEPPRDDPVQGGSGSCPTPEDPRLGSGPADAERIRRDRVAWDAFVAASPQGSFLQLTAWARANAVKGWRVSRLGIGSKSGVIGAQLLVHRMRPGPWSRAYAPRGPIAETFDAEAISAFTASLRIAARHLRLSHVVIDPELPTGHAAAGWLAAEGWRHVGAVQINKTRVVDLTRPHDELWSALRSSARWSVNRARRAGYATEDAGEPGLDDFERIYLETASRVGFQPAAFMAVYREFAADGAARLLLAREPGGEAVAALVLLTCGRRLIEFYGASTLAGARGRANYLLKWEAIRSSQERGFQSYDMWGTDQQGLAEFKAGFGGEEREYIGAWELITDPGGRWVLNATARTRRAIGSLRNISTRRGVDGDARSSYDEKASPDGPVVVAHASDTAPEDWDELTVKAPGGHVMQGTAWAAYRRSHGARPRYVTFDDGRAALVILRSSPLLPGATASVRRGPVHAGDGPERLAARAAALAAYLRTQGVRDLFLDPEFDADARYDAAMDGHGFRTTAEFQPSIHVMRLKLSAGATEASVLASFTKSTRQRIRAAEKAGITVREDTEGRLIDAFGQLLVERAKDLGIDMRPETGYLSAWRHLVEAGHARLLVAEHERVLLGGLLLYVQGGMLSTAYSADRASLRHRYPGTMHLVRWRAIQDALAMGAPAIELGGVDLPGYREPPQRDEPNHGLYEHKSSFGAEWIVRTPARRIVLRPRAEQLASSRSRVLGEVRRLRPGR